MDIPIDAEKCPYCRSSQKPKSTSKIIIWIIVIALLAYGAWFAFTQYKISGVKNGYLSDYSSTVTVGMALDSFLGNPKWKYGKGNDRTEVITVTGSCTYDNKRSHDTVLNPEWRQVLQHDRNEAQWSGPGFAHESCLRRIV